MFAMVLALVLGAVTGVLFPGFGASLNPIASAFIKLIKMVVALLIFSTLTIGVARIGSGKEVGRIALRSLIYFEVVSTLALMFGLFMGHLLQPGSGMHIDASALDPATVATYTASAVSHKAVDFFLNIIPNTIVDALASGNLLQVLLIAVLFGFALMRIGKPAEPLLTLLEQTSEAIFNVVGIIMKAAPLAVFGAVAYAVGKFGFATFATLGKLVAVLYLSCGLFVVVAGGAVAYMTGFSLWRFITYLWDEIVLVYATASSEVALPRLIAKLERAGCAVPVVGFVVPTGYSFNLTGSSLYMTLAALFIAQAVGAHVPFSQEMLLLGILLVTSKGVAGIPAASLVTLAGALTLIPEIPVAGIALVLGVDRFMDSMRSVTNFIGNGVATMAIAKWEGERDDVKMHAALNGAIE